MKRYAIYIYNLNQEPVGSYVINANSEAWAEFLAKCMFNSEHITVKIKEIPSK